MNTEMNNANPAEQTEEEARRANREADDNAADNAAAATAEADDEADNGDDDEAEDNGNAQVMVIRDAGTMRLVMGIMEQIEPQIAEHIEAIREDEAVLTDAKAYADDAKDARTDVWSHVVAIVGAVAEATADKPNVRRMVYDYTMSAFLEDKTRSTAKAYASTGRSVLVKLLTEQRMPLADVQAMKYSDVRAALRPAKTAEQIEAERIAETVREQLAFIVRNAGKLTKDVQARMERIATVVEREYNPVKSAKDAGTKQAQAAREVADLKQQSPREGSQTETVNRGRIGQRHVVRGEHRAAH